MERIQNVNRFDPASIERSRQQRLWKEVDNELDRIASTLGIPNGKPYPRFLEVGYVYAPYLL